MRHLRSLGPALFLSSSLGPLAPACAASPEAVDKGIEEDVPVDGKLDSFRSPTDHGRIGFDRPEVADLTAEAGFHAWTFNLEAPADVVLRTNVAMPGSRSVDTVLYLYREGPRGFGRALTSNDDAPGTLFSAISRRLEAGRYRVLVKGYARSTRGPFSLAVTCSGAGCGTPPVDACLFGATFSELRMSERPRITFEQVLTAADLPTLPETLRAQIVRAVQQSAHTDVTTVEEAFMRVDGGQVNRLELYDGLGARTFTAIEYGAGDNSYGAIFSGRTTDLAARIQDGDLAGCNVGMEICRLGTTYREFAEADRLTPESERVITAASEVSGARAQQLLRAVQEARAEVTTVAAAIAVLHHHVFFCHMKPKAAYEDGFVGHDFLAVLGAFDLKEAFQIYAGAVAQLGQTVEHRALIRHTIRRRMTRQETIGAQGRGVRRRVFRTRSGGNAMLLQVVGE